MQRRSFMLGCAGAGAVAAAGQAMAQSGDGFFVPAEEAPQQAMFLQWPVSRQVYRDVAFLKDVQATIAKLANTIAEFQPVTVLAAARHHSAMRRVLSKAVTLWDVPTEDLWCRDSGPIFVRNDAGALAVRQIQFNGWGGKQVHRDDAQVARRVAERLGLPVLPSGLVGEAGGVEQDGHGLLMAHESSWLTRSRNPGLSREDVEARLLAAYGATRMIWSKGVVGEDITDYHIDSLARFTGPGRVLMNMPDVPDPGDPFHQAALATHDRLQAAGLAVEVIPEPYAPRVQDWDFVASYANYVVCNGAVITAEFGDNETDALAQATLARHFPEREIVPLDVDTLGLLGGGIHCATQQMPASG